MRNYKRESNAVGISRDKINELATPKKSRVEVNQRLAHYKKIAVADVEKLPLNKIRDRKDYDKPW